MRRHSTNGFHSRGSLSPFVGEAGGRGYLFRGWPGPFGGSGARGVDPYRDRDRTLHGRAGSPGLGQVHPHVATHQGEGSGISCGFWVFLVNCFYTERQQSTSKISAGL